MCRQPLTAADRCVCWLPFNPTPTSTNTILPTVHACQIKNNTKKKRCVQYPVYLHLILKAALPQRWQKKQHIYMGIDRMLLVCATYLATYHKKVACCAEVG